MGTPKIIEDEFGAFEDEVLNAGWMPSCPDTVTSPRCSVTQSIERTGDFDVGSFMKLVYAAQE